MKLKKLALKALCGLMSVALVACMLTSCSKGGSGDKLVENIPSSSVMVLKFNPQQIIENAGCKVDNGKIVLSEAISNAIKENAGAAALNVVNTYLAYTEGMNLDAILCSIEDDGDVVCMGTLSDPEPVKKHLKELFGNQKDEDGFVTFEAERNLLFAIKDNMIFWSQKLGNIKDCLEEAAKNNIAQVKGVGEFLSQDNAMAFVLNFPELNKELQEGNKDLKRNLTREGVPAEIADKILKMMNYYACFSMKFEGNTASGEFFLVDNAGTRSEFGKMLNVIDTDFLQNVPAGSNMVAACGNIADPEIKKLIDDAVAENIASCNAEEAQYFDLITKWDGTAAMALECNEFIGTDPKSLLSMSEKQLAELFFKDMKFVFMAHYPAEVIDKFSGMLFAEMQRNGANPATVSKGFYSVDVPDMFKLFFGNKNGYLAVGTGIGDGDKALADKFAGKRFVMYGHNDVNPVMANFGWDFGSESELWLEADALKFRTQLIGTDAGLIQAIIEPLTDMNNLQNMMQYFMEFANAADNTYDYDDYYDYSEEIYEE